MTETITSTANPLVKDIFELTHKKNRDLSKKFLVEGIRSVEELLLTDWTTEHLLVRRDLLENEKANQLLELAHQKSIPTIIINDKVAQKISDTTSNQGLFAVAYQKNFEWQSILAGNNIIILDNIQDPGNLGTLIRTANATNISALVLRNGVDIYSPKVVRSSMGSLFSLPFICVNTAEEILTQVRPAGFSIIATSLLDSIPVYNYDFQEKTAVILGNENSGISDNLNLAADQAINIPQNTHVNSLNVAIAGAMIMYEMLRQRNIKLL